jgi:cell division septation protein DedD
MAEIRRGFGGEPLGNERLPWLEPVEDEDDLPETGGGGGGGRVALWLVVGLVVIAVLFGGFIVWQRHRAQRADIGEIIHALPGAYKEKPANPGGLPVNESDVIASRMGTGNDIDSPIDLSKIPEQPITGAGADKGQEPQAPPKAAAPNAPGTPAPAPVAKAPPKPALPYAPPTAASAPVVKAPPPAPVAKVPPVPAKAPAPAAPPAAGGGGTIQLGALASEAKAKQVWKSLSSRFSSLAPLTMSITPVKVGDNTLYRLRASGGDAGRLCAQLKVAGETCNVVH